MSQLDTELLANFCEAVLDFSISAHLFSALRHVIREKGYVAPEAVSERYAPFYEINSGHCGISA
jgi:hypothetical protein